MMNDECLVTLEKNPHSSSIIIHRLSFAVILFRTLLDPFVGATVNSELGNTNKVGGQDQRF